MATRKEIETFENRMLNMAVAYIKENKLSRVANLRIRTARELEAMKKMTDFQVKKQGAYYVEVEILLNPRLIKEPKVRQEGFLTRVMVMLGMYLKTDRKLKDGDLELDRELHAKGLPMFRLVPEILGVRTEIPMKMYTIECSNCKALYGLYVKKLPDKLNIAKQYHRRTPCCKAPFYDAGYVEYTPEELAKARQLIISGGVLADGG